MNVSKIINLLVSTTFAFVFFQMPEIQSAENKEEKPVEIEYKVSREVFNPSTLKYKRQPANGRPYVFPRSQFKYGLWNNYMIEDWWMDRPLYFDREYRKSMSKSGLVSKESFLREIKIIQAYEADGLANLANYYPGHVNMYNETSAYLNETNPSNYLELPEFGEGKPSISTPEGIKVCDGIIKTALKSKYSFRIGGKVVITSYAIDTFDPNKLKTAIEELKKLNGDTFLFAASIVAPQGMLRGLINDYYADGAVSPAKDKAFKDKLRSYADFCDGIMFTATGSLAKPDKFIYEKKIYYDFYENYLIPAFLSVLSEKKYKNKIFGLSATVGYINKFSGVNTSMDGTKRLRKTLESAFRGGADFIIMPEWNEANENTSVQPTLWSSLAYQRIIKYYMRIIKKENPVPNPGDDLSIPNMILSYRKSMKLGETLEIELLNVPETDKNEKYTAELSLCDIKGNIIKSFPQETFSKNIMSDVTYSIPTESLSDYSIILPRLELSNDSGKKTIVENLMYVSINPTNEIVYMTVKQPVRDLLKAKKAEFTATPIDNGKVKISGDFETDEPLASLEVLENCNEIYAFDKEKEFDRNKDFIICGSLMSAQLKSASGKISIKNTGFKLISFPEGWSKKDNQILVKNQRVNTSVRFFVMVIPKENLENAEIEFDLDLGKFSVPVKDIQKYGLATKAFNDHVLLRLWSPNKISDTPPSIDSEKTHFTFTTDIAPVNPIYQLRAVSKTGKIFRSKPIAPFAGKQTEKVKLNVMSESKRKPVEVDVYANMIPDIRYDFIPRSTDIMTNSAGNEWNGELGGGIDYCEPFHRGSYYPPASKVSVPEWVMEDGFQCLKFDGFGTYINFPRETFPRGAFTLEFEIKPESSSPQVIFRHHGLVIGSLTLKLENNMLSATYTGNDLKNNDFETKLPVPLNQWSRIRITYDLHNIAFDVNGKKSSYKFSETPVYFATSVFGGHGKIEFGVKKGMSFFKGYLKSLRIYHNAN